MSYTVSSIPLAPIPGVHNGTGTFSDSKWLVDTATVALPVTQLLAFEGKWLDVTTMLFEIAENVVPNWFGVAIPNGIADFTTPHIFFHPTPAQAGYIDSQYADKSGKWPELFYYIERLGYQLDGAQRNQIIIMPFLTEAAKNTGIFAANWQDIVTGILTQVRAIYAPSDTSPLTIGGAAVSSFSAGIIYSDAFRKTAPGWSALAQREVWDFDGKFSSYSSISQALHMTAGCPVIQYDQLVSNDTTSFHVPQQRWVNYVQPPTSGTDVHGLIRDCMFMHGATISTIGSAIEPSGNGTTATATATHTFTNSATSTSTQTHTATHSAFHTGSATHTGTSTATKVTPWPASPAVPLVPGVPGVPVVPVTPPAPVSLHPGTPAPALPVAPPPFVAPSAYAPGESPPPAGPFPASQPQAPHAHGGACFDQAIVALVANVSATAQTAITAITAISTRRKGRMR